MKRKINLLVIALMAAFILIPSSKVYASQPTTISSSPEITPYKDVTEWIYKIVDGKLYRRLYNKTMGCWIGDWELVS